MNLLKLENNKITSLQIVEEINFFRNRFSLFKAILKHSDLLKIIRDEFEEEISQGEISLSEYESRGKKYPMFLLSVNEAKQILVRESKVVRKAVIKRLDELETLPQLSEMEMIIKIANSKIEQDKRIDLIEHKVENMITLDSGKQRKLQKAIACKVYDRSSSIIFVTYGDCIGNSDKDLKKKLFSSIHRELKNKFGIASYKDVKAAEFEMAMSFIESWIENAEIREEL